MPVSPTGPISLPLSHLRLLVADCTAFRTWVGAANQAAALAKIHLCELPAPAAPGSGYTTTELQTLRPCAIVDLWTPIRGYGEQPQAWQMRGEGGPFLESGKLTLDFLDDVDVTDAAVLSDAKFRFLNNVGAVVDQMLDLSGSDGYLNANRIEVYQGPGRADERMQETYGDHWRVQLLVQWGV